MACPQWSRVANVTSMMLICFLITVQMSAAAKRPHLWEEQTARDSGAVHQGLTLFMSLAEKLSPAVANISIVQKTKQQREPGFRGFRRRFQERQPFGQDPFREFFDRYFSDAPPQARQSLGSGFIIHPKGLILTNNHVIEEADKIKVTLQDEREFEAHVIGRDPKTDLALIKVESDVALPTVPSIRMRCASASGSAIGNPFSLSHTVTAGIVSAKGRVIGAGQYDDFIERRLDQPRQAVGHCSTPRRSGGHHTAILPAAPGSVLPPINLVKSWCRSLRPRVKSPWLARCHDQK